MNRIYSLLLLVLAIALLAGCAAAPAAAPTSAPKPAAPAAAATSAPAPAAATAAPATAATSAPAVAPPAGTVAPQGTVVAKRKYTMAFANWNETNSFAVIVRKSMEANAQKYGVELINFDNKQDPQQANTNVDNALTKKVDFYFQYNQDVEVNRRIAQRLKDAGVKGIGIQVCMGDFPCYHVDNFVGGNLGGKAVAEAAKKKWTEEPILFVIGYPESGPLFQERARGAIAGAQAVFPNVKVFENTSKGDPERGRQITADFLTAHPTGKIIIWTHVDQMALAALSAIKAAGRTADCLIASTGPDPSIFPELRNPDGIIVGTAGFFPEKWGDDLIPLAIKWLNGETTPPAEMNPFTQFINKENINQFYPQ